MFGLKKVWEEGTNMVDLQNGFFVLRHPEVKGYTIRVQASNGEGWEHVSVTVGPDLRQATRNPTWIEMCWVKDAFWDENQVVMQLHPRRSEYVSTHLFCLHLWRPTEGEIPTPPAELVGVVGDNKQSW